jgi:pimeloyl-ACP methyl ester carboxylesterase
VAPDQRGYNTSDKPCGAAAFVLDKLADDIFALADALGHDWFSVVGHDWGASVAWWMASRSPARLDRLAILNAPHPDLARHDRIPEAPIGSRTTIRATSAPS